MSKAGWLAVLVFGAASVSFTNPTIAEMIERIEVGSGASTANLYLEFKGGAWFDFIVRFDDTTTGLGLFDIIEEHTTLTTERLYYESAVFIDGISYAGYDNSGWGGDDDWWHYWAKDGPDAPWQMSGAGVSARVVEDGFSDGWIYGQDGEPIPEPAAIVLLACGLLMFRRSPGTAGDRV